MTTNSFSHYLDDFQRKLETIFSSCFYEVQGRRIPRRVDGRKELPKSAFALPEKRKFPIHDASHAEAALIHLLQVATKTARKKRGELKMVYARIKKRWPTVVKKNHEIADKLRERLG